MSDQTPGGCCPSSRPSGDAPWRNRACHGEAQRSQEPAGRGRKVLIVSANVGAGHRQAARAIQEALRLAAPGVEVERQDVLDHVPRAFRIGYQGGYVVGMTRLPQVYGLGFELTNRPDGPERRLSERLRLGMERFWLRGFAELLVGWRADLIVHTHFLTPPVGADLRRRGRLGCPQMVVVTDNIAHRWWYCRDVDRWFLPDEASRQRLARWGVPAERMTVCGIPVHPKWTAPLDRRTIYADWRLPADRPIVILTGGTEFTCGPIVAIARGILRSCRSAHVVVLAGRNKRLLAELSALPEAGGRLTPVSFTDRVHELVEVCSVMVTKPGGVTTAECCAKGAPMVLLRAVPGQEACNARHLCAHGAAVAPGGPDKVVQAAARLLADEPERARMSRAARGLYRPAAGIIAEAVAGRLERPPERPADWRAGEVGTPP